MRLGRRFIAREAIISAANSYEIVEAYPDDKYFPSYLLLGRAGDDAFHVLLVRMSTVRTFELSQHIIRA